MSVSGDDTGRVPAVVGCGGIGRAHAAAYAAAGSPAVAFVDPVLESAKSLAALYGGRVFASPAELPSEVEVVSVTTPPGSHYEIAEELLESGRHVWCEKPLGQTADEAKALVDLARTMDRALLVGFKYHYEAVFEAARKEIPKLGKILAATCVKTQGYPRKPVDWVATAGVLIELSIHDLDLLDWYLRGPDDGDVSPTVVDAKLIHRFDHPAEDQAFLAVRYPSGAVAQVAGVYAEETKFLGHDVMLSVIGDRGFLRVERPDRIVVQTETYEEHRVEVDAMNPFEKEARNLFAAIRGEEALSVDPVAGIHANSVIDQAHKTGRRI